MVSFSLCHAACSTHTHRHICYTFVCSPPLYACCCLLYAAAPYLLCCRLALYTLPYQLPARRPACCMPVLAKRMDILSACCIPCMTIIISYVGYSLLSATFSYAAYIHYIMTLLWNMALCLFLLATTTMTWHGMLYF